MTTAVEWTEPVRSIAFSVPATYGLYADWASFTDEPAFQDPEVAAAAGYTDAPLPPGALSALGLLTESERARLANCSHRSWRGERVLVAGAALTAEIRYAVVGPGLLIRFIGSHQEEVASESFSENRDPFSIGLPEGASIVFETGPVDSTRLRAACYELTSLSDIDSARWEEQSTEMMALASRFLLPSLIAIRSCSTGPDVARQIGRVDVFPAADADRSGLGHPWTAAAAAGDGMCNGAPRSVLVATKAGRLVARVDVFRSILREVA